MRAIEASAGHPHSPDPSETNSLAIVGADNADDADDFGKSSAGEKPGASPGWHTMPEQEEEPQGQVVVNGFAISATPEDRHEPEPERTFARIWIRTHRPEVVSSGRRCAQCGEPGGSLCAYSDAQVRLHQYCERAWIDAYEASNPAG